MLLRALSYRNESLDALTTRSIAGGIQYSDEVKKVTKQRRYAFNNPVRFVGEPVAAVAAVNRHVAEEALALITVDYEVLPFVLDMNEALKPEAPKIWPEGNLALNNRDLHRTHYRYVLHAPPE